MRVGSGKSKPGVGSVERQCIVTVFSLQTHPTLLDSSLFLSLAISALLFLLCSKLGWDWYFVRKQDRNVCVCIATLSSVVWKPYSPELESSEINQWWLINIMAQWREKHSNSSVGQKTECNPAVHEPVSWLSWAQSVRQTHFQLPDFLGKTQSPS